LYKFSYANLREYSRLLSAFIAAEKHKGLAVEVGEDLNIKVVFSTLLGLKGTQRDSEAVLVQV
jgi:centromere protein L